MQYFGIVQHNQIWQVVNQFGFDLNNLSETGRLEIIELANKIRTARILFQSDSTQVPNFNQLRVEVQKLQNKINAIKK